MTPKSIELQRRRDFSWQLPQQSTLTPCWRPSRRLRQQVSICAWIHRRNPFTTS
jgi:hypothetical protein